ncbi:MAG TPA: hypothetical protein VGP62_14765 [Bryobacteraceae bacterium]|nr:hypothetical protein [Bryobacteraceae bacterium]
MLAAFPVFGGWYLAGPFGGSARAIAIDPENHNTLLAGARDSLVFRSDDAGSSWRLLPFPPGTPGTIDALIIDPFAPGHFYAGLDAGDSPHSGMYESRDGGEHWQALAALRGLRVESLAAAPSNARALAAGTSQGVYLSTDAGESWQKISAENNLEMRDITALAFDPVNPATIYAGTPHLPWKTTDSGANWQPIAAGLIDDSDIFSIRVDPKRPQVIFASACSGIYRSENSGELWTKLRGIPGTHRRTHVIAQDPRDSEIIFAGTTLGLFKSPDGGRSWLHLSTEQVNWMVFDPQDPQVLYLATEFAGILKSPDSGQTFAAMNRGFVNHSLTQITGSGNRLYATSIYEGRHGGVFRSLDGGLDWTLCANEEALAGRNLSNIVAAPSRQDLLFATTQDEVLKSVDSGKTWSRLIIQPKPAARPAQHFGRIRIQSLQVIQLDKLVLFAGTQSGLFRSSDVGATWERLMAGGITGVPVLAIYAPPRGASRLAVRTSGSLFISEDAGRNWRPTPLPGNDYYLYDLALPADPGDPLLAATSRGLLQSTDNGAHWNLVTDGVPAATVNSVRFHPLRDREAFLIQYGKVYRSFDAGASWQVFPSEGLENASAHTLWLSPDNPGRMVALSAARGALVFDINQAGVVQQTEHVVSSSK